MGLGQSVQFSDEQLEAYQDCTFFTKKEIVKVANKFRNLAPEIVPIDMTTGAARTARVPKREIECMQELKENPFRRRIVEVFSEDGSGNMCFDDFLDMLSVFHETTPRDIKAVYAFKIYDFDGDGFLNRKDLSRTLGCLTRNEMKPEEMDFMIEKAFTEVDINSDGSLSYNEFEHVISKSPDFMHTFHIRV